MINKLFGGLHITWKRLVVFALAAGIYTGVINQIYVLRDTSFRDIAVTYEWWFLFAVLIAANAETARESALKIFVFFLISQPVVFLVELKTLSVHDAFMYYRLWIPQTVLTLPGGWLAWHARKNSVFGALVLSVATSILAILMADYGKRCMSSFPSHLLTTVFIFLEITVFILALQKEARNRILVLCITLAALAAGIFLLGNEKVRYMVPLPEGEWVCKTELTDGSSVVIENGNLVFSYDPNRKPEVTLILENEEGESYTLRSIDKDGAFWLVPEDYEE